MSDYSAFFNRSMNRWMCKCGSNNAGEFCDNCGLSRAEGEREKEEDSEIQSPFQKPVEQEPVEQEPVTPVFKKVEQEPDTPSVTGSMFSSGSSDQPFMKKDTSEEDMGNINPFKPASAGEFSGSVYSSSSYEDDTPRSSRQSYVISNDGGSAYSYSSDYVDPHRRKISNRLSLISVILKYGVGGIMTFFFSMINGLALAESRPDNIDVGGYLASYLIIGILGTASTVGIILMIVARVKDKRAPFAKVLMIIYILEVVLGVLFGILVLVVGVSSYLNMVR